MVGDLSALLIDADDRQVFHLKRSGRYEPESLQAWADMIQYGDTVLDVGAYTGLYSILAAKKGATVYALEPMPANAWRCSCNFDLNQYPATSSCCGPRRRTRWGSSPCTITGGCH